MRRTAQAYQKSGRKATTFFEVSPSLRQTENPAARVSASRGGAVFPAIERSFMVISAAGLLAAKEGGAKAHRLGAALSLSGVDHIELRIRHWQRLNELEPVLRIAENVLKDRGLRRALAPGLALFPCYRALPPSSWRQDNRPPRPQLCTASICASPAGDYRNRISHLRDFS